MHTTVWSRRVQTAMEKMVTLQLAEFDGKLPSALACRVLKEAARQQGIWPPDKWHRFSQLAQEMRCV